MSDLPLHKSPPFIMHFPLLFLALAAYNIAMVTGHAFNVPGTDVILHVQLISGAIWDLGWNETFMIGGLCLLFIEIMKSTRAGSTATLEHVLSMFVFICFLIEFLIVRGAGTNTFLILGLMSLIDVMAGYAISIAVARKEMNITG
ncbi:MAG: hypothetical protein JWO94_246 [Verrucomicrobiaceae bacterium]|nr:hypothetical protein [Verrucomicrobiaceae bacterium]